MKIKDIPILKKQWDFSKNEGIDFNSLTHGSHEKVWWKCEKGHSWDAVVYSRSSGNGCPYCSNQKVLVGFNDMWTTNPKLASMLLNVEDGYIYTISSGKKVDWRCLDCKSIIKNKRISDFYRKGFFCPTCDDGIKYPEKFLLNLLNALKIEYIKEKVFEWSENKRYDFFIENTSTIIEVHGIQHYKETNFSQVGARNLEQEQENDNLKRKLALNNVENYIVINASVANKESLELEIRNSILSKMYDLDKIDFDEIDKLSQTKVFITANSLWNEGYTVSEILKITRISNPTLLKYLKKGNEIGLSDYSKENSINRHKRVGKDTSSVKLTEEDVKKIIELTNDGWSRDELSNKFGIHKSTITRIRKGKAWSHVTGIAQ